MRQERSSLVTNAPTLAKSVIGSETPIESDSDEVLDRNVEESKRDVSLEELLNGDSQGRQKRINKDKKSVQIETRIKNFSRTHKKSLHSTPTSTLGECIVLNGYPRRLCVTLRTGNSVSTYVRCPLNDQD